MSQFETANDFELAVIERLTESLALEFKSKEFSDNPTLTTVDKRNIAKSVSAMANGDGGTLVFGVKTETVDGLDTASTLAPIAQVDRFAVQFEALCATAVIPRLESLQVRVVHADDSASSGFLVCDVPQSLNRPHMTVTKGEHRYYRRTFEGNVHMTPSEIRDQILAVREAVIHPEISFSGGGLHTTGDIWSVIRTGFSFKLSNNGRAVCRSPFLRASASCRLHAHSATYVEDRAYWKTEFAPGWLIHVGDSDHCYNLNFVAFVRWDVLQTKFVSGDASLTEAVIVQSGEADLNTKTITDKISLDTIEFALSWGAENASIRSKKVSFSRQEIAQNILRQFTIKDHYLMRFGAWRQDLLDKFTGVIDK